MCLFYQNTQEKAIQMKAINEASQLQSCKVWMLKTSDAHGLYKQFGYTELGHPEKVMERIIFT
jgi:hypothetical protein